MNLELLQNFNAKEELARRNFSDFVGCMKQDYTMKWFHRLICEKLQDFNDGKIKKLMIFMPPQHGKSELCTRQFPAYLLGKNPNRKIVVASYNATLASRFNRDIQRVIDNQEYHSIFPETVLNESNIVTVADSYLRNSEIFEIVKKQGFLKTVGRGGALTGTSVDIGIIDDPLKDRAEAKSKVVRDGLWSWYEDVFETRLHNNSQQILIQTRWDVDDLAGRLLKRDNDWHVLTLEAIKETDYDYDIRDMGEPLWGEKHSLDRLNKVRLNSPITFGSLYQQNPKPTLDMGLLWDERILDSCRVNSHPHIVKKVIAIDPATTSDSKSDETGIVIVGKDVDNKIYVLKDLSGRYSPNEWGELVSNAFKKYDCDYYSAEKNQGGDMVKAMIRQYDTHNHIRLVHASKGKYLRAEPVFAQYEQGKVYHVGNFPILERQMLTFNPEANSKSPDRVDALVYGVTELMDDNNTLEDFIHIDY